METEIGLTKIEIEKLFVGGYIYEISNGKYKFLDKDENEEITLIENGR